MLSDHEIKQRMQLGLVTNVPYQQQQYHSQHDDGFDDDDQDGSEDDRQAMEDWDDLQDSDDEGKNRSSSPQRRRSSALDDDDKDEYVFDTKRRSSVDLDSLSANLHDLMSAADTWDGNSSYDFSQNKRRRSKKPNVASIKEHDTADDEEIETVNGDDVDGRNS